MRIALIVRALPVHRLGGLEYHTWDLANALQKSGCHVTIITSRHPQGCEKELLPSGVEVFYLPTGPSGDYSMAFFRGVEKLTAALDSQKKFDIIHAQEFAGIFMKPRPGRFVVTVHGTLTTETPLDRRYFAHLRLAEKIRAIWIGKARVALTPFFQRMLRTADLLLTDSRFTQRELAWLAPAVIEKTTIVPLGVDLGRYNLPTKRRERRHPSPLKIVLLGRVQIMRGLLEALAAAYRLRWHNIDFRMRIGGTCSPAGWIDDAIAHFLLEDVVDYEGQIPAEKVSEFLEWGDLFLFPDRTQPAFGLACVEAMLHGLPVLATRVGAVPEVVPDSCGWLCDPWNAQDMTVQLVRIAGAADRLEEKSENAWHHARRFTAEAMAQRTLACYEKLLGGRQ